MTMTPPLEKPVDLPERSPGALWGAAHLAWGVAIFVAMVYAAQQLPVDSTDALKRLALVFFGVGLACIALCGWRVVERGWRLRRPQVSTLNLVAIDLLTDGLLALAMFAALARSAQSRLLTAGLDRLVTAIAVVSLVSLVLSVMAWCSLRGSASKDAGDCRLAWARFALAAVVVVVAAAIEFTAW